MNKIIITGRITKDIEIRNTASGIEVANFTVAVDRRKAKDAEKMCDFVDCVAWGKTCAFVSTYFHKGDGINVEGRLESRKWQDKNGQNRVSWEVQIDNVEFPHGKNVNKGGSGGFVNDPAQFEPVESDNGELPF